MLVNRSEVAGLVLSVVVVSGEENFVSEVQDLAPAAFEVFRGGGVRQSVGSPRHNVHKYLRQNVCILQPLDPAGHPVHIDDLVGVPAPDDLADADPGVGVALLPV